MKIDSRFFNHDAQAGGFYPMAHVGVDIANFAHNQNVLIEGIRGTGKTHVLKMINKYYLDNFTKFRILPVFVSLAQISEHAKKDPEEFRLHLYTHVIENCVETIQKHVESLQPDLSLLTKALNAIARLLNIKTSGDFEDTIEEIRKISEHLKFSLQFDTPSGTFKRSKEVRSSSSDSNEVKLSGRYAVIGSEFRASSSSNQGLNRSTEESSTYLGSKLAHRNASQFLIEFLKNLQVALNLEYSLILLDECSEANFASQIEIFRLFKTIRGTNSVLPDKDTCSFFVGCVYPRGETYYPTREVDGFFFQPGQDCTLEFLQWDETDFDAYVTFFEEMTLARARYILNYDGDYSGLESTVFEGRNTFLLAAYAANGIPRRYWELLKQSYDQNQNKVTNSSLYISIQEIANSQILSQAYLSENSMAFIDRLVSSIKSINREIRRKNNKLKSKSKIPQTIYFSVKRGIDNKLTKLVIQGAIHEKARTRTTRKLSRPEPIYAVDMAVAYTYRLIPQKVYIQTIIRDIPLCASGDFNKAPYFRSIEHSGELKSSVKKATLNPIPEGTQKGRIKVCQKNHGFVKIDKYSKNIFFHRSSLVDISYDDLNPGDLIEFNVKNTKKGLKAIDIKLKEKAQCHYGIIKSFQSGKFGFIEVADGGPNAFFDIKMLDGDVKKSLGKGLAVSFFLNETTKKRQAIKIKIESQSGTDFPTK